MTSVNGCTVADNSFPGADSDRPDAAAVGSEDDILSICSSLSQSYSVEWERLFLRANYLRNLRSYGMHGKLRCSRFRSVCWKLFLGVLPEDHSHWSRKTKEWRNHYEELKNQLISLLLKRRIVKDTAVSLTSITVQCKRAAKDVGDIALIVNPRKAEARDLSINNPLSQEVESPWNRFFLDNELRLTIKQDVVRTFPDLILFREDYIREIMVNILFCYARLRPRLSYRQGMHELLAPLIFVLHCDQQTFLHASELESVGHLAQSQRELTKEILNHEFLEHDAYALFYQVMETVEPWYVSKEVPLGIKVNSIMHVQPFARCQDLSSSNVIITKLTRIQDYLLKRFDNELYEYLQRMDIVPQIYGIRWIRLLFGREFAMQELLMLWDAIFADGISFDLVDYLFVAMLLYLKEAMLSSDYPSCLYLLMKYPPIVDIQHFINHAVFLREPHEQPKPPDLQYQKPNNFGTGSWENSFPQQGTTSKKSQSRKSAAAKGQRPGSLVIVGKSNVMSKSTSEPMNLITDASPADLSPESAKRKGSSASLSQIEGSFTNHLAHHGLRSNLSTQSLARLETVSIRSDGSCSQLEQMSLASSDGGNVSPKTGKYFILGNRGGRRQSGKQKQQVKANEQDVMKLMACLSDLDSLCRRCAIELDLHIGVIQKSLFRRDDAHNDDEALLALAGIKQVRDVLKGALKPSSAFGSPEHLLDSDDFPRYKRQSSNSAQSSQSATPLHDKAHGKFYLATPDLLSSDTDVNSPDGGLVPERNLMERNPSNDTIVPSRHSRSGSGATVEPASKSDDAEGDVAAIDPHLHSLNSCSKDVLSEKLMKLEAVEGAAETGSTFSKDNGSHRVVVECSALSDDADRPVSSGVQKPTEPSCSAPRSGQHSCDANRNFPPSRQERSDEQRIKQEQTKESRRRDGSPIDRLADMFKNLTKF